MKASNILETIGDTPHVRINRLFGDKAEVWIKSERANPGGSIKDRIALAMVEEDHGHQVALNIARQLVMFLVRPGGQAQYSHMLSRQAVTFQPLRELQVWMLENIRENLTVETLAERVGMSPRHFARVCERETGLTPGQFVDRMRVEAAQQMIDSSTLGLKQIDQSHQRRPFDAELVGKHTLPHILALARQHQQRDRGRVGQAVLGQRLIGLAPPDAAKPRDQPADLAMDMSLRRSHAN